MTENTWTVLDIETDGRGKTPWTGALLRAGIGDTAYRMPAARREMHKLMQRPGVIVEHTTFDARWALLDGAKLGPRTDIHDLRTMAWLLNEEQPFKLSDLMLAYLGERIVKPIVQRGGQAVWSCDLWPLPGFTGMVALDAVPDEVMDEYSGNDLGEEARLYERLRALLQEELLWGLFLEKEVPLTRELVRLETAGLPYDSASSETLRAGVRKEADHYQEKLVTAAGVPVNLASTPQMARLLFTPRGQRVEVKGVLPLADRMREQFADAPRRGKDDDVDPRAVKLNKQRLRAGLPKNFEAVRVGRDYVHGVWVGKGRGLRAAEHGFGSSTHWKQKAKEHKTPSTSSVSLVLANPTDDYVADLVYWRELDKLEGSFLAKFPQYVHDGRLYGTVNRCGTVTGRFSSSEPNLQNIPAHGQYGALVRALFRGRLALGDYAQLEQRIAAHYSMDPLLLKAYEDDVDLYGLIASMLFGGEASKKHEQRGLMKTGMLSLQYRAGAGKLAQLMLIDGHAGATKEGAEKLIAQLHKALPDFFAWSDDLIARAIHDGYVQTIGGRYRRLTFPDGWAKRRKRARQWYSEEVVAQGYSMERQAANAPCQGSAADVVAGAMVAVAQEMSRETRTLVQVHDELLWERLDGWDGGSLARLRELCETGHGYADKMNVRLKFEAMVAKTWADKGGGATNISSLFRARQQREKSEGLQSRKASGYGGDGREAARQRVRETMFTSRAIGNGGRH